MTVPRARFGADPWTLEPPGVAALMDKLRANGVPLREFAGVGPLYGVKTGCNEAFLIDTPTKDKLVAADPESEPLFRPYLRGQDVDRWRAEWSGLWMIALKSSGNHDWPWAKAAAEAEAEDLFRQAYPALHAHMAQYRAELTARQDQGEHWWELRACAYWDRFDQPKVMYQDITWNQRFCLDTGGMLSNNTVYFLPTDDLWAMAVLNVPVSWWFAWRTAQHGKDEALRLFTDYLNGFPIPRPNDGQRAEVEAAVGRLIAIAGERQAGTWDVLDWLRTEFGVAKPSQKLQAVADLDADAFVAEVKKGRPKGAALSSSGLKQLRDEYATSVEPLRRLVREADVLERRVSDVVNAAYGLTPAEVALMWDTAPPRMPVGPPVG